jgi:hypothetical protein
VRASAFYVLYSEGKFLDIQVVEVGISHVNVRMVVAVVVDVVVVVVAIEAATIAASQVSLFKLWASHIPTPFCYRPHEP